MKTQLKNSITALLYQMLTLIVGLILPRLIIQAFGSEVNGLVSSVNQFLSYATLIEGGIGGVVRAALYKALAAKDNSQISSIIKATECFFKKIAVVFLGYVAVLAVVYPQYINDSFDMWFTGSLIVIMAISSIVQYFFGLTYSIFLQADKKNYIVTSLQICTYLLNAILTVILIYVNASIHTVKLVSAAAFVITPIALNIYVKRKYHIEKKVQPDTNALSQRWNSMAHHVAWFLHTNTDIAIITFLGALSDVSIYSVYYMVASSLTKLLSAIFNGVEALLGNILAAEGEGQTKKTFVVYSMCRNSLMIVLFATAGAMLMPFISLYTADISDANYFVPLLGYMLLASEAIYCMRVPYHSVVTVAGHFKQTQGSAIIETVLNIGLSVVLFVWIGLPGVAIATAVAMLYRTVYYIVYLSKHLIHISLTKNLIRIGIASLFMLATACAMHFTVLRIPTQNYLIWVVQAMICVLLSTVVGIGYCVLLYKPEMHAILQQVKHRKGFTK